MKSIFRSCAIILTLFLVCILTCSTGGGKDIILFEDVPYQTSNSKILSWYCLGRDDCPEIWNPVTDGATIYTVSYEIDDGILYVVGFDGSIVTKDGTVVPADLNTFFGDLREEARVAATWFSGELWLPKGDVVETHSFFHHGGTVYEWNIVLHVQDGKIVGREIIDNRGKSEDRARNERLMAAVRKGDVSQVETLLDEGADVNARSMIFSHMTPLMFSVQENNVALVRLLLERGAAVNRSLSNGDTALMDAAWFSGSERDHLEIVKLLIDHGADVNAVDITGGTALAGEAIRGQTEAVKLLLEKGADVNARENDGNTPLLLASMKGYTEVARLLLEHGADGRARNKAGYTPWKYASENQYVDLLRLLEQQWLREE